jgi:hypothetical protein
MTSKPMRILLAVDGSDHGVRATAEVLRLASLFSTPPEIHLLFVHAPVPGGLLQHHVSREALNDYYREEGKDATRTALRNPAQREASNRCCTCMWVRRQKRSRAMPNSTTAK